MELSKSDPASKTLDEVRKANDVGIIGIANGEFLGDVKALQGAEIAIRRDGRVVWINVDGVCRMRILLEPSTPPITIDDRRTTVNGG
jgi:hypothetical protein